jgi:hypothetical protein
MRLTLAMRLTLIATRAAFEITRAMYSYSTGTIWATQQILGFGLELHAQPLGLPPTALSAAPVMSE